MKGSITLCKGSEGLEMSNDYENYFDFQVFSWKIFQACAQLESLGL